jgi:hypothetical protein
VRLLNGKPAKRAPISFETGDRFLVVVGDAELSVHRFEEDKVELTLPEDYLSLREDGLHELVGLLVDVQNVLINRGDSITITTDDD